MPNHCLLFLQHLVKLFGLLDAALPRYNGSHCALYGCLLVLQILNLLGDDGQELRGVQTVYAVEEDSAVVVRD